MACTVLAVGAGQQAAVLADFDRVLLVTLWELENASMRLKLLTFESYCCKSRNCNCCLICLKVQSA